jgi:hypothetical protein
MKKALLTILTLTILTVSYGQETKEKKDNLTYSTSGSITTSKGGSQIKFNENVAIKIDNKLNIESDSAFYDKEKNLLITYGTKKFSFNGTVTVKGENGKTCKYYLGTDTLTIE